MQNFFTYSQETTHYSGSLAQCFSSCVNHTLFLRYLELSVKQNALLSASCPVIGHEEIIIVNELETKLIKKNFTCHSAYNPLQTAQIYHTVRVGFKTPSLSAETARRHDGKGPDVV